MASNYLKLTFLTDTGHQESFNVSRPVLDITSEEIKTAMDGIVNTDVYSSVAGRLAAPYSAELVTIGETQLV